MNRKINTRFIAVTFTTIILTLLSVTAVFYEVFKSEVVSGLETYANVLKNTGVFDSVDDITYKDDGEDIRITLISTDGVAVYDNEAEVGSMENHSDRPEVVEAFESGVGEAVRTSTTLGKSTFYYAILLDNGYVLRIAKETGNIWSLFANAFPVILVIAAVIFLLTTIVTHFLTRSIVRPIELMANNLDNVDNVEVYKEMKPFANIIKQQHEAVLKNANVRQEFTANVSHELKTPLTAISGYSELIESGITDEEDTKRFAKEIHHNSNRLLSLINDTIRLSELDTMENELSTEELDLFEIAKNTVNTMQVSADKHEVELDIEGESAIINADRMMMEELVYNLIDNAVRYNVKEGKVQVSVHNKDGKVILNVKDTGIGIPEEAQNRVFERFYRVDKSRSKSTGGTGLGLAIVKHIVARHNAGISLKSEVGKGTEIEVQFCS